MTTSIRLRGVLSLTFVALVAVGCDDDPVSPDRSTLALELTGFEPLRNGFHYEGWAIIGGTPMSTGRFNVGTAGQLVTVAGAPIAGGEFQTGLDLSTATAIVITVEPNNDSDPGPAATHIAAGDVNNGMATLTVAHSAALGNTFTSASGTYILATPTDGPNSNERSGVWFLNASSGSPTAGLSLPALPAGWTYEGWAVINGMPVTTGTFRTVTGADMAAPFSGPQSGPPFPGEDFLRNAPSGLSFPVDLRNDMVVITIEPDPDDSPTPFVLKPLTGTVPGTATDHVNLSLANGAMSFPTGRAVIH
jgi:hypothetical protein